MWFPYMGQEKVVMCRKAEAAVVREGKRLRATHIHEVLVPIKSSGRYVLGLLLVLSGF